MIARLLNPGNGKAWARMLALGGTLAATVFLMWQSDETPPPRSDAEALRGPAEPDGFIVQADYRTWDEQGNPKIRMTSPRIEQFDSRNLAAMEQPRATLYGEGDPMPWIIEADKGSLQQNNELVHLNGNVVVSRQLQGSEATLKTQALTLNNAERTVYTDQPVVMSEPHGTTQATGMKAWIDDRILELNSRVEGQYEPIR
ncbi:LPS export ABC transporter periplasmic protein LptC [Marinobacter sp. SS5-14b]|uniref:LPS export ABC transporter periplasmic protein LptC n=1 Tax=Marinobacter sp. SS5-14b TaxID=3050456 RepID=UPI0026E077CC|nr:LPS export ABC transporter periplasmic protein LptC [Marinobacter sp. SS5-14b]